MSTLHPLVDFGLNKGSGSMSGGTLQCHCTDNPAKVQITGDVAFNHACGCSKCWKPKNALFSIVGVVPNEKLEVTSGKDKLHVIDSNATILRHACKECGVHMYGDIEKDHPFKPFSFVHVELSNDKGWQEPQFAAFVSSIIEQGYDPEKMSHVRGKFKSVGLETYDCLSPALMDMIATHTAKQSGALAS